MIYQWKPGARLSSKVQAAVVGAELERIESKHGAIDPRLVVIENSAPTAPLYRVFEWDDRRAADEYRVVQAREIIRGVVVVADECSDIEPVRAFVRIAEDSDGRYRRISIVMSDDADRAALLRQALRELNTWKERYKNLVEFSKLFNAIEEIAA